MEMLKIWLYLKTHFTQILHLAAAEFTVQLAFKQRIDINRWDTNNTRLAGGSSLFYVG